MRSMKNMIVRVKIARLRQRIAEHTFFTVLDIHSSHGADGVPECKGEEKVRLGELATKDEEPE